MSAKKEPTGDLLCIRSALEKLRVKRVMDNARHDYLFQLRKKYPELVRVRDFKGGLKKLSFAPLRCNKRGTAKAKQLFQTEQQLEDVEEMYAGISGYDPDKHGREDLQDETITVLPRFDPVDDRADEDKYT